MPTDQQFKTVPDTFEGWVMRVLSILLALLLVAVYVLFGKVDDIEAYEEESRRLRIEFQEEQRARTCILLDRAGVTPERLGELQC